MKYTSRLVLPFYLLIATFVGSISAETISQWNWGSALSTLGSSVDRDKYLDNGILKKFKDFYVAQNFIANRDKPFLFQKDIVNWLNFFLSHSSKCEKEKRVVRLGIKASLTANYSYGPISHDWYSVAKACYLCLLGVDSYEIFLKIMDGKFELEQQDSEIIYLAKMCHVFVIKDTAPKELSEDEKVQLAKSKSYQDYHEERVELFAAEMNLDILRDISLLNLLADLNYFQLQEVLMRILFEYYCSDNLHPILISDYNTLFADNMILQQFSNQKLAQSFTLDKSLPLISQVKQAIQANSRIFGERCLAGLEKLADFERNNAF